MSGRNSHSDLQQEQRFHSNHFGAAATLNVEEEENEEHKDMIERGPPDFESDSVFEILNDWEKEERGKGRRLRRDKDLSLSPPPLRLPLSRPTMLWRDRVLDFCTCFACYVLATFVIALCIYFMYRIFSTIRWSSW